MNIEITPDTSLTGAQRLPVRTIHVPPDKSIFHRLLLIGSLTTSRIHIPITSIEEIPVDVYATILALQSLGVPVELSRSEIELQGVGIRGYHEPKHQINCANSGTTARLLMGILCGQKFQTKLTGDNSLSVRPMKRLASLLENELGAHIETAAGGTLPILLKGSAIHGGIITLPVSSAQMKSAALLAGLHASERVTVTEPTQSRDHTEQMLKSFGAAIEIQGMTTSIGAGELAPSSEFTYHVPGDVSSAAFLIAAAALSHRDLVLPNVSLNATRTKFLDVLVAGGLDIERTATIQDWGEDRGRIEVHASLTTVSQPLEIRANEVPLVIDELPILAVLAAFSQGQSTFSGLGELRYKESDRLKAIISNLQRFGVRVEEKEDGFVVHGDPRFIPNGGAVEHFGDHRIAMAFAVMALRARGPVTISDSSVVSISYPRFFEDLALIAGVRRIKIS